VRRQGDLLQVVLAARAGRRLAHLLHRRQKEADQDRDNRDHDQQLNERETTSSAHQTVS